jgi:hypothetical protein
MSQAVQPDGDSLSDYTGAEDTESHVRLLP